jgi:flagellar biosynthesis regulator FlaF
MKFIIQLKTILTHTIAMLVNHRKNGMHARKMPEGAMWTRKLYSVRHVRKAPS